MHIFVSSISVVLLHVIMIMYTYIRVFFFRHWLKVVSSQVFLHAQSISPFVPCFSSLPSLPTHVLVPLVFFQDHDSTFLKRYRLEGYTVLQGENWRSAAFPEQVPSVKKQVLVEAGEDERGEGEGGGEG